MVEQHQLLARMGLVVEQYPAPAGGVEFDRARIHDGAGLARFQQEVEALLKKQLCPEVFDVTGAGDTVIATLAALVASGLSLRQAMPLANRAGGIVVGKFGTATITFDELMAVASSGKA